MYDRLNITTPEHLEAHVRQTVWNDDTECFIASIDRECYYHRESNTRIVLNYLHPGTCLVTRSGPREWDRQRRIEADRLLHANPDEPKPPAVLIGGVRVLHPDLEPIDRTDLPPTD